MSEREGERCTIEGARFAKRPGSIALFDRPLIGRAVGPFAVEFLATSESVEYSDPQPDDEPSSSSDSSSSHSSSSTAFAAVSFSFPLAVPFVTAAIAFAEGRVVDCCNGEPIFGSEPAVALSFETHECRSSSDSELGLEMKKIFLLAPGAFGVILKAEGPG